MDLFSFDSDLRKKGYRCIAGVDEAGRGPWAGPVVAAAVVFPDNIFIKGLNDSKKLSPSTRLKLFSEIHKHALSVGLETVEHSVIDSVNILNATYIAMKGALKKLNVPCDLIIVDGSDIPHLSLKQFSFHKGDSKSASIAAASIIAKVTRDEIMLKYSGEYPEYSFYKHKGYGTREHRDALCEHGPCPIHRKSFSPVRDLLNFHEKE